MSEGRTGDGFLPDFCSLQAVFPVVVIGELLAFVLVLRPGAGGADGWRDLALTSLFIQWVGLSCCALLCLLRARLARLAPVAGGLAAYALVLLVLVVLAELAYRVGDLGYLGPVTVPPALLENSVFWLTQQPLLAFDLDAARHVDFMLRTVAIGAIVAAVVLRYMHVHFQWKHDIEAAARARVAALQARIRPHFLFNAMNTIASLTRSRPALAEEVVEDLSDLLRASLADPVRGATLEAELELARGYLRIEALRLGERLQVDWQVDGLPGDVWLPPLTLQPLVENAVYHGIEPLAGGGSIGVHGWCRDGRLYLRVSNPLAPDAPRRSGHRVAQASVRERLALQFGSAARFEVSARPDHYSVELAVPLTRPAGAPPVGAPPPGTQPPGARAPRTQPPAAQPPGMRQ